MTPSSDDHIITVADATALARACLVVLGLSDGEAAIVADHLVDSELCGHPAAGLARIPVLAAAPELRQPRRPPAIERETPVSALIAGGNSLGYLAMHVAVEVAIDKARRSGIAIVGIYDSWNSGRSGYWVEKVARTGLAAFHVVSTPAFVVPEGATARGLGTNPLAIALPSRPDPLVVDLATSATSWAEVLRLSRTNGSFATAVGVGLDGVPTGLARDILNGGLRPFGAKGQALAFAVQAIGLMVGARRRRGDLVDFGYLLIAFDPTMFGEAETFENDLADFAAHYLGLPTAAEAEALRVPSRRASHERRQRQATGIAITRELAATLARVSRPL